MGTCDTLDMTMTTRLSTGARIHAINRGRTTVPVPDLAFELVLIRNGVETVLMTASSIPEALSLRRGFGITDEQAIGLASAGSLHHDEATFILRGRQ